MNLVVITSLVCVCDVLLIPILWFVAGAGCESEVVFLAEDVLHYTFGKSLVDLTVCVCFFIFS